MKVPKLNIVEESDADYLAKQWLEYSKIYLKNISSSLHKTLVLNELNNALSSLSFLGGNTVCSADKAAFNLLHDVMGKLSFQEKEKLIHLSRWYGTLQSSSNSNEKIKFSRTLLYY